MKLHFKVMALALQPRTAATWLLSIVIPNFGCSASWSSCRILHSASISACRTASVLRVPVKKPQLPSDAIADFVFGH